MSDRRKIDIYYNVDLGALVDSTNTPISSSQWPTIYFKENPLVRLHLYQGTTEGTVNYYTLLPATMSFSICINETWNDSANLLVKSNDATDVNISGDWDLADITAGRISVRLNGNTTSMATKLASLVTLDNPVYMEIQGRVVEDSSSVLVFVIRFPFLCYNLMDPDDAPSPTPPDPLSGYYPISMMDTFLAAKSDNPHTVQDHSEFLYNNVASSALQFNYRTGKVVYNNVCVEAASGVLTLNPSTEYVIEIADDGVVHATLGNTFTKYHTPLYAVTANTISLTVADKRSWLYGTKVSVTGLTDAPSTYSGSANYIVKVLPTEDGLFYAPVSALYSEISFLNLNDTPDTYSGKGSYILNVNSSTTGVEFSAPSAILSFRNSLSDTPKSFSGKANYLLHIDGTATSADASSPSALLNFRESLSDTPKSYVGASSFNLRVNKAGSSIEFYQNDLSATGFSNNDIDATGWETICSVPVSSFCLNGGDIFWDVVILKGTQGRSESVRAVVVPNGLGSYNVQYSVFAGSPDINQSLTGFGNLKVALTGSNVALYAEPTTDNWEAYGLVRVIAKPF